MKLTKVIGELIELWVEHGDIEVKLYIPDRDYGDSEEPISEIWAPNHKEPWQDCITLVT